MRSIIYHDLNLSNYIFKYDDLKFYFSSKFYLDKFTREYVNFIKDETMKLKIKFKCNIYADYMIMLLLYKQIEKKGFKVSYKDRDLPYNYAVNLVIEY